MERFPRNFHFSTCSLTNPIHLQSHSEGLHHKSLWRGKRFVLNFSARNVERASAHGKLSRKLRSSDECWLSVLFVHLIGSDTFSSSSTMTRCQECCFLIAFLCIGHESERDFSLIDWFSSSFLRWKFNKIFFHHQKRRPPDAEDVNEWPKGIFNFLSLSLKLGRRKKQNIHLRIEIDVEKNLNRNLEPIRCRRWGDGGDHGVIKLLPSILIQLFSPLNTFRCHSKREINLWIGIEIYGRFDRSPTGEGGDAERRRKAEGKRKPLKFFLLFRLHRLARFNRNSRKPRRT